MENLRQGVERLISKKEFLLDENKRSRNAIREWKQYSEYLENQLNNARWTAWDLYNQNKHLMSIIDWYRSNSKPVSCSINVNNYEGRETLNKNVENEQSKREDIAHNHNDCLPRNRNYCSHQPTANAQETQQRETNYNSNNMGSSIDEKKQNVRASQSQTNQDRIVANDEKETQENNNQQPKETILQNPMLRYKLTNSIKKSKSKENGFAQINLQNQRDANTKNNATFNFEAKPENTETVEVIVKQNINTNQQSNVQLISANNEEIRLVEIENLQIIKNTKSTKLTYTTNMLRQEAPAAGFMSDGNAASSTFHFNENELNQYGDRHAIGVRSMQFDDFAEDCFV